MSGLTHEQRSRLVRGRFGPTFHLVVSLASTGHYRSRAEIAREVGVTRARVKQILETADARGILPLPFDRCPNRAAGLLRRRAGL